VREGSRGRHRVAVFRSTDGRGCSGRLRTSHVSVVEVDVITLQLPDRMLYLV